MFRIGGASFCAVTVKQLSSEIPIMNQDFDIK
jgi:hypothetical protein